MSWAEVKKINSDLSTPVNIASLINHIDLIGSKYVGYDNEGLTKELVLTNGLYNHEIANTIIGEDSLSTQGKADGYGYIWLCKMAGTPYTAFSNLSDVFVDTTAFTAIVTNTVTLTRVLASTVAMTEILASTVAVGVILANTTVFMSFLTSDLFIQMMIESDSMLHKIAQSPDNLEILASSIGGKTTVLWESDLKWQTIYDTLVASPLFTKSGLLTDASATFDRSGNLIDLIFSAYADGGTTHQVGIVPEYTGCFEHAYANGWSTGKHIMWGGQVNNVSGFATASQAYVKHYMFTPIV